MTLKKEEDARCRLGSRPEKRDLQPRTAKGAMKKFVRIEGALSTYSRKIASKSEKSLSGGERMGGYSLLERGNESPPND